MRNIDRLLWGWCVVVLGTAHVFAADIDQLISDIQAVGREGAGHGVAVKAQRELIKADAEQIPAILHAIDTANPIAANWLRGAVESIADRTTKQGGSLPTQHIEQFIRETTHSPQARRFAYNLLTPLDPTLKERLIPGMLHDPSREFRRDAVARLMTQAGRLLESSKEKQAIALYEEAFSGAVDDDQVKGIVKILRKLGRDVDLQRHFGFLPSWHLIGPFDNHDDIGFDTVYPPEKSVDLDAEYEGQLGTVRWERKSTQDDYGVLDIAQLYKNYKGSLMYATTEFSTPLAKTVQFRFGTANAWKLWLNGQELFSRHEYHRGMRLDQYRITAPLKAGKNRILLKLCQNEQTQDWAQRYSFQFRVCDETGVAILSSSH